MKSLNITSGHDFCVTILQSDASIGVMPGIVRSSESINGISTVSEPTNIALLLFQFAGLVNFRRGLKYNPPGRNHPLAFIYGKKLMMLFTLTWTLFLAFFLAARPLQAANLAFDSAANAVYNDGWQATDNGGFGFTSWAILPLGNSSHFLGSSTANGDGIDNGLTQGVAGDGDIDTAGRSWGLFSQGNGAAVGAYRQLTGGPLSIGQSIGIDMDNGGVDANFFSGVQFLTNTDQILFRFHGGDPTYEVYTQNLTVHQQSTLPFADEGLSLNLLRTGSMTFDLKITLRNGNAQTLSLVTLDGDLQGIVLQNSGAGISPRNDAYFNSMRVGVVPEPASIALLLFGLARLGTSRRR